MPAKVPTEDLVVDLRRVADELGEAPTIKQYNELGEYSSGLAQSRFGSWNEGLRAAGLEPNKRSHISKDEVIADLRRVAAELGEAPTQQQYREHGEHSLIVPNNRFGSWNNALEAAGLELNQHQSVSKDEIIKDMRRVADELGRPPSQSEYTEHGEYWYTTAIDKFGTFTAARQHAGLEGGPTRPLAVPKQECVQDIQRVADEIGETPTQKQYNGRGEYSIRVAIRRFGSWNDALQAAGFDPNQHGSISKEEIIADIQRVANELGRPPSESEITEHGEFSPAPAREKFGSWSKAVKEAGFEPNTPGPLTGERAPNYKGGYESYYGPTWRPQRRAARSRDGYECQVCGMNNEEHLEEYGSVLHVHHIRPFREFGVENHEEANRLRNLITLCRPHHMEYEALPNKRARSLLD